MPELSNNQCDVDVKSDDSFNLGVIKCKATISLKQRVFSFKGLAKRIEHANYGPFNNL